jgi:hypothetical protein
MYLDKLATQIGFKKCPQREMKKRACKKSSEISKQPIYFRRKSLACIRSQDAVLAEV